MENIPKKILILKLLIINIFISLFILIIALWTSFPYLHVNSDIKKMKSSMRIASEENLYPAFRYDRYDIELDEKAEIDLILSPETNIVKVEVIGAEGVGLGIDSDKLLKKGLKIITPHRPRNKPSKREEILEERIFRTKLTYNLKRIENKSYLVKEKDYKVYKIAVKGVLPGAYTLKASTTDGQYAITTILTKPEFRIDSISPSILDIGVEGILTVEGRSLDSFTQINLGNDIEIKDIQASDNGDLKVSVYVTEGASRGFRNVTITNLLIGNLATLVNGLYIGPKIGQDGKDGKDGKDGVAGKDGEIGPQGPTGVDGMSICNNAADTLMVFANNLSPGSQATSFFDPVLCNLTLGIPIGTQGSQGMQGEGSQGLTGATGASGLTSLIKVTNEPDGSNCDEGGIKVQMGLDSNQNNVLDSNEIASTHYVCNGEDD